MNEPHDSAVYINFYVFQLNILVLESSKSLHMCIQNASLFTGLRLPFDAILFFLSWKGWGGWTILFALRIWLGLREVAHIEESEEEGNWTRQDVDLPR